MNKKKTVAFCLSLVLAVILFSSCDIKNVNSDFNSNSTETIDISSEINSKGTSLTEILDTSNIKKVDETSADLASSCPDIYEHGFKNTDEIISWINDSTNITFAFPEFKEKLEPLRDLIIEKGLLFPTINGKPLELDYASYGEVFDPNPI